MFRRIKVLQSLMNVRYKGVKIEQIQFENISKADRIKKLHFENKHLYGAKREKKGDISTPVKVPVEEPANPKDLSAEIYWTCLHIPEVQDFTKPKRKAKEQKIKSSVEDSIDTTEPKLLPAKKRYKTKKKEVLNVPEEELELDPPVKKTTRKKTSKDIVIVPELPYTLTQLSSALPPVRSRNKTQSEAKLKPTESDSDASSDEDSDQCEIPFEKHELRAITNFPLMLKNNKIISPFDSFVNIKSSIYIPSVSKVLQTTMPESQRAALIQWKNLKITELGLDGFNIMQQSHLSRGKQFHQCLQSHFRGETIIKTDLPPEVVEIWNSIEPLLGQFEAPGVLIEEKVNHPYLLYQGIVDCVSFHDSTLSVIEWKKSDRQKKSLSFTYDAPIQLSSYLGALNASREEFRENPIKTGVVVVAYNDGQKADLFELNENDLKKYWKLWLHRLQEYWVRYRDNTLPENI